MPDFDFVSRRVSLDLVGTLKWRRRSAPEELLAAPRDFGRWALAAGLVDAAPNVTARGLREVHEVRELVYRLVRQRQAGGPLDAADVEALNVAANRRGITTRLEPDAAVRRRGTATQVLATVAADALDLLGSPAAAQVRECGNIDCTRLFVDASRGAPRRWCGMSECGNRAKVAAFRGRRRATAVPA